MYNEYGIYNKDVMKLHSSVKTFRSKLFSMIDEINVKELDLDALKIYDNVLDLLRKNVIECNEKIISYMEKVIEEKDTEKDTEEILMKLYSSVNAFRSKLFAMNNAKELDIIGLNSDDVLELIKFFDTECNEIIVK